MDKFIQVGSSVEYGKLKSPHIEGKYKVKISSLKSIYAKAKLSSTNYLVNLYNKDSIIAFTDTDFPDPVVPAINT